MMLVTVRRFSMVLVLVAAAAWPVTASAGGCEVLQDPRDRAECVARQHAREAARAEVERQVEDSKPAGVSGIRTGDGATPVGDPDRSHSAAWQAALDDADGFDPGALLEPRPVAAVGGLTWFLLVLRSRRRARARTRRA